MLTRELIGQYTIETNQLCQDVGCQGFLFDMRGVPNYSPDFDNYQFVYQDMDEMELSRNARSAILINEGENTHDFPEVLLHNAGYNIKLFTDEQEAIAWLSRIG